MSSYLGYHLLVTHIIQPLSIFVLWASTYRSIWTRVNFWVHLSFWCHVIAYTSSVKICSIITHNWLMSSVGSLTWVRLPKAFDLETLCIVCRFVFKLLGKPSPPQCEIYVFQCFLLCSLRLLLAVYETNP